MDLMLMAWLCEVMWSAGRSRVRFLRCLIVCVQHCWSSDSMVVEGPGGSYVSFLERTVELDV